MTARGGMEERTGFSRAARLLLAVVQFRRRFDAERKGMERERERERTGVKKGKENSARVHT